MLKKHTLGFVGLVLLGGMATGCGSSRPIIDPETVSRIEAAASRAETAAKTAEAAARDAADASAKAEAAAAKAEGGFRGSMRK